MWHALSLQILFLWSPKNKPLFAIHLLYCHCLSTWGVCSGMLNMFGFASLKTKSFGNYYAKHKNKGRNTGLYDLDSKLLSRGSTNQQSTNHILGDRDFLHTDLQSSPLLPWYHFSMPAKTFVLIFKIIHGLTPSCLKFASMNPADSYVLWRLHWPQSWEQSWGHSTLCSGHLAKEQQSGGKQL